MYKVTKYAQSCFLIAKDNLRCLIDPGRFVYEMDNMKLSDWPKIDVVLITHEHADHADINGIRFIVERDQCPVITNASFAAQLNKKGIPARAVAPGESVHAGGFHVSGVAQRHGTLSGGRPIPEDIGFVVDSVFYTPGDSIPMPDMPQADVLFVPVIGPDMSFDTAHAMIEKVQPKVAIPTHYANTKSFPIELDDVKNFSVPGTQVRYLADGESMKWEA